MPAKLNLRFLKAATENRAVGPYLRQGVAAEKGPIASGSRDHSAIEGCAEWPMVNVWLWAGKQACIGAHLCQRGAAD